jgi:hypothetical protein
MVKLFRMKGLLITSDQTQSFRQQSRFSLRPVINFKEHPVFQIPFFVVHGCAASKLVLGGENYVLSWLSVFGPSALYKLPLDLFICKNDDLNA